MSRTQYASRHKSRYITWGQELANSPYSPLEMMELAIISACTPYRQMVAGFLASRDTDDVADSLHRAGVLASRRKARDILALRASGVVIEAPESTWRLSHRVPGLGLCKLSFGLALANPLGADVVCLDTHVCWEYGVDPGWVYRREENYIAVEKQVVSEAKEVGLPPFLYQWSTWDFRRLCRGVPPENHSFLWPSGPTQSQTVMDLTIPTG